MIGHTIMFTGFVIIGMSVLVMSSAFLPPGPVLLSLLLWGACLLGLLWLLPRVPEAERVLWRFCGSRVQTCERLHEVLPLVVFTRSTIV